MSTCRVYEQNAIRQVTGQTIRPGDLTLTDRALNYCSLAGGARLLDVGCGTAATVEHLRSAHGFDALGIDPSSMLTQAGKQRNPDLPVIRAQGERLPFATGHFDALLAECSLSLMDDIDHTLAGFYRVLRAGGWLIISDMYARSDGALTPPLPVVCCLSKAFTRDQIIQSIEQAGFTMVLWEDHSEALKQLAVQIIMTHGSMADFWQQMVGDLDSAQRVQERLSQTKPGYFLLIANKSNL